MHSWQNDQIKSQSIKKNNIYLTAGSIAQNRVPSIIILFLSSISLNKSFMT